MKTFLINVFLFVLIVYVVDYLIFFALQKIRPVDYKLFLESKQQFFKVKKDFDILIIGDSHIADAVDPAILKNKTHLNAFNFGVYHSSPYENYHILKSCLNFMQKPPKILILGTNPILFTRNIAPGKYTPLLLNSVTQKWNLYHDEGNVNLSYFFKTVQEKYLFISLKNKIFRKKYTPTRNIFSVRNGYLEIDNQIPGSAWENFDSLQYIPTNKSQVQYFEKSIELAQKNNIQVVIVNPPLWKEKLKYFEKDKMYEEFQGTIDSLEKKYDIKIFNKNRKILMDDLVKEDFLNSEHLNGNGAKKFTEQLAQWLSENFQN